MQAEACIQILNFLKRFSTYNQISILMKIHPFGNEFFPCRQTDRRRAMTKLLVAFDIFAKSPKIIESYFSNFHL